MRAAAFLLIACAIARNPGASAANGPAADDEALIRALEKQDVHAKAKKVRSRPIAACRRTC